MPNLKIEQLQALGSAHVLVLGDLILDHYIKGYTERTSPEAPVPVVVFQKEEYIPGGAANVARNIAAAGAAVSCIGIVGQDNEGNLLLDALRQYEISTDAILRAPGCTTTTKTRIMSQGQQIVRVDREASPCFDAAAEKRLLDTIHAGSPNAILLSDYAKGLLSDNVIRAAIRLGRDKNIPVLVDPKGRDYTRYHGAYAITPNAKEAFEATGISTDTTEGLTRAATKLFEAVGCEVLAITRGAKGVALFQRGHEPLFLPTSAREIFDVTGAGDTFVAFLALGCATGLSPLESAELANAAAGVVVGKSGAAVVTVPELRAALMPGRVGRKLRQPSDLAALGAALRAESKKVVFTNGCFDFLHAGHVAFLQQARALGDVLVLACNTDDMIARLKGEGRPVIAEEQRLPLLASIEAIDYLVPFSDETPHLIIEALKPDLLVKGNNLTIEQVEGRELVESYGGQVQLLEVLPDIITHQLVAQQKLAR